MSRVRSGRNIYYALDLAGVSFQCRDRWVDILDTRRGRCAAPYDRATSGNRSLDLVIRCQNVGASQELLAQISRRPWLQRLQLPRKKREGFNRQRVSPVVMHDHTDGPAK